MKILGVDPGLGITGYGVVSFSDSFSKSGSIELLEAGVIRTRPAEGIAARLHKVYEALSEVVTEFRPDALVIEKIFTHTRHPTTAILMGHVRGVVCLLSGANGVPLFNLPSTHVKKSLTGNGHAAKHQIQRMIQHRLGLRSMPEPADVADALALAIAYGIHSQNRRGARNSR